MKLRFVALALVMFVALVGVGLLALGTARAQTSDECIHAPTISSLRTCVHLAADASWTHVRREEMVGAWTHSSLVWARAHGLCNEISSSKEGVQSHHEPSIRTKVKKNTSN